VLPDYPAYRRSVLWQVPRACEMRRNFVPRRRLIQALVAEQAIEEPSDRPIHPDTDRGYCGDVEAAVLALPTLGGAEAQEYLRERCTCVRSLPVEWHVAMVRHSRSRHG